MLILSFKGQKVWLSALLKSIKKTLTFIILKDHYLMECIFIVNIFRDILQITFFFRERSSQSTKNLIRTYECLITHLKSRIPFFFLDRGSINTVAITITYITENVVFVCAQQLFHPSLCKAATTTTWTTRWTYNHQDSTAQGILFYASQVLNHI